MVEVSADGQCIAVVIDQCRTEPVDISRTQIGVPDLVTVVGRLQPVRVQGVECRTLDVAGILADQHPLFHPVECIRGTQVGEEVEIVTFDAVAPVVRLCVFSLRPGCKRQLACLGPKKEAYAPMMFSLYFRLCP